MPVDEFIAIDLGAETGRAALARLEGDRLAIEERHRFFSFTGRMNGTLHWNLLSLWEDVKLGVRKCVADQTSARKIDSIGVDAWGIDFGLVAPTGEILSFPVHYRDRRTENVMDKVFQRV